MDAIFQEERRAFYNFLNFMPIGLYVLNAKGKVEYVNKTLSRMLNTSKENILGKGITDFLPQSAEGEQRLNNACSQYTAYVRSTDGGISEYLVKVDRFKQGSEVQTRGAVIGSIPTDASLKQAYEEAVSETNSIFNLSPFGMMLLDTELVIKRINQRFMDILGIPSSSQPLDNYLSNYLDEDSIGKIKNSWPHLFPKPISCNLLILTLTSKKKTKTGYSVYTSARFFLLRFKFGKTSAALFFSAWTRLNRRILKLSLHKLRRCRQWDSWPAA